MDDEPAGGRALHFVNGEPPGFAEVLQDAKRVHQDQAILGPSPVVLQRAVAAVNERLSAGGGRCRRSLPDAAIEVITDSAGALVYRCHHASPRGPHRWPV